MKQGYDFVIPEDKEDGPHIFLEIESPTWQGVMHNFHSGDDRSLSFNVHHDERWKDSRTNTFKKGENNVPARFEE